MIVDPFADCAVPSVLFGTGTLYVTEGEDEVSAGNFSSVDLVQEGVTARTFAGTDQVASIVGATSVWRLILTGDTFSIRNLARILNLTARTGGAGESIFDLQTVRMLALREVRFEREIQPLDCNETQCLLDIRLWRTYFDLPNTWTFSQDEPTIHVLSAIAIPDAIDHPDAPFGEIEACSMAVAG